MNFPPDPPSSTASGSDNNLTLRPTRPQQSVWGQASSQAGIRRGLTPLATSDLTSAPGAATRRPAPSSSPGPFNNNTTSPLASTFSSVLSSSNRLASNRQPSSSSLNSPFTIFQAGAQQPSSLQSGASVSSPRSRTITPLPHLVPTATSASTTQGGGAAGGGGGLGSAGSRSATYSPSLPGTNITSPTAFSFERSAILPSGATAATTGQASLSKISVAQVLLLLDTISEKEGKVKWEQKADQIRKLVESNGMDVFSKFFRRLVSGNTSLIFPGTNVKNSENAGNYPILVDEMQKVLRDPDQAIKIAETIDGSDGDIFRDFDLVAFIEHFKLDPVAESILALAFRSCTRADLRNKADAYLADNTTTCLQSLSVIRESNEALAPAVITYLIEKLAVASPKNFGDDRKAALDWAVRHRFQEMQMEVPEDIHSTLQLLRIPEPHQIFLHRIHRNGPKSTATVEASEDLLASVGLDKLDENEVSNALLFMILCSLWKRYSHSHFVSAIRNKSRVKRMDWQLVIRGFDLPDLQISQEQFLRLFDALLPVSSDEKEFDIQALWGGLWSHPETQRSFLKAYLFCEPEKIKVSRIPRFRPGFRATLFDGASEDVVKQAETALQTPISSADAVGAVMHLALSSEASMSETDSQDIINHFIHTQLATFILCASSAPEPWTTNQQHFVNKCFNVFLLKQSNDYRFALEGLWRQNRDWVFKQLHFTFINDPMTTINIFECAQEFGWTNFILELRVVHPLTLDIACVLHRDEDFDIERWLRQAAEKQPAEQVGSTLLKFLRIKAEDEYRVQHKEQVAPRSVSLVVKTVFSLLLVLEDCINDHDNLMAIQRECVATYPRLVNYGEGFDDIIDKNGRDGNALPESIDKQMSDLFGRMYREELSFREVLELMRKYKTSQGPMEQDLFTCIIHGLFDEYHCYNEYPPEALMKTAVMFGGIINFKLMSGIPLKVGLSLILDAVRENQPEDPMYKFGVEAIEQLVGRLPEWLGFCSLLVQIPTLRNTSVYKKAMDILREQGHGSGDDGDANGVNGSNEPFSLTNGNIDELLMPDSSARHFSSLHADPPAKEMFEDPDQVAQDKMLFVLNNMSKENLPTKLKDLQDVLKDEHYQWFASHLVEQRAKLEPNFQPLYMSLLELIGDKTLLAEVLRETYVSAIKMMNAEATNSSATERGQLKNLGGWLGSLTIARDKPIKHKNMFFKELLLEGYDTNRLPVVIPFTCKVLVQGAKSTVFKPPNPWLMDILALLMELYHYADLKLNLKFEIEVLCKDLELDHKTVEPSTCLQDRPAHIEDNLGSMSGMPDGLDSFDDLTLGSIRAVRNERLSPTTIMQTLPRLDDVLKYPPPTVGADPGLVKDIVYRAFEQAIQEIIAPVVERSITIASISTAQLIQKDFTCEADEEKIRSAARQMVKSLAGSLALVTCKEPLRMSITNYIRRPTHMDIPEQLMPEGAILMCVNDNLDTACGFVEKAAEERAVPEIDRFIEPDLEERRRYLASGSSQPFASRPVNQWASLIPDPFKQIRGIGLNEAQMGVYADFARQVRGPNNDQTPNVSADPTGRQLPDVLQEPFTMPNLSTPAEPPALPHQTPQAQQEPRMQPPSLAPSRVQAQINGFVTPIPPQDKLQNLLQGLAKAATNASVHHVRDIPKDSLVFVDFQGILQLLAASGRPNGEVLARFVAEKICTSLYNDLAGPLEVELMAHLLAKTCQLSELVSRDVFRWMSTQDESQVSNVPVTFALLDAGLVEFSRIDTVLSKFITQRKTPALHVLAELLDLVLFNDAPLALRADFSGSLEAMNDWLSEDPNLDPAIEINRRLRSVGVPDTVAHATDNKVRAKQDQMEYIFNEWIVVYQNLGSNDRSYASFLKDLHQKQVINDQEDSAMFFRVCIDACVSTFESEAQTPNGSLGSAYAHTDGLAKLIILLVKLQGETNGAVKMQKASYLKSILSLIVLVQNHHQVMHGTNFNQRVFYRLFSSILCEYTMNGMQQTSDHREMMIDFANTLLTLQPTTFPGFAYGWLSLISHRVFMPGILNLPAEAGSGPYCSLVSAMLRYIGEQLSLVQLTVVTQDLYKGVLRILLVLHHDFPEFVADNHFELCNAIPTGCTQLRNLILSAYPQSIQELPDPFTGGLKADRLDEMKKAPFIASDVARPLVNADLKKVVDGEFQKGADINAAVVQICNVISAGFAPEDSVVSSKVNHTLINALVLYVGEEALANPPAKFDSNSPSAALLVGLSKTLPPELRFHFLGAIANQLRYPNTHTNYFCKVMIHLFSNEQSRDEHSGIRQQILRVILERLIVHRPHPWGLLVTLSELERNPAYRFWELPFIVAAPEVKQIFQALSARIQQPLQRIHS